MGTPERIDVGGFASIVSPGSEDAASWVPAAFPDPGGGFWTFAEPNAVVIVQDGRLRVAAATAVVEVRGTKAVVDVQRAQA